MVGHGWVSLGLKLFFPAVVSASLLTFSHEHRACAGWCSPWHDVSMGLSKPPSRIPVMSVPLSEKRARQPVPLDPGVWCREELSPSNPSFGSSSCLKRFWKLQTKTCSWDVGGRAPFATPPLPVCTIPPERDPSAFLIFFIYTGYQTLSLTLSATLYQEVSSERHLRL